MKVTDTYIDGNGWIIGYRIIADSFQEMQGIVRGYCYQNGYTFFDKDREEIRSASFKWPVNAGKRYFVYIDNVFCEVRVYEEIGSE